MAEGADDRVLLRDHLVEQGYTEAEIAEVLQHVSQYDEETTLDAMMQAIAEDRVPLSLVKDPILVEYLRGLDLTDAQIVQILEQVRRYDEDMTLDAIMQSITSR